MATDNDKPGGIDVNKLVSSLLFGSSLSDVWSEVTKTDGRGGGQAGKEGFTVKDERDGLLFGLLSRGVSAMERQAQALESIATVLNKREERRATKN